MNNQPHTNTILDLSQDVPQNTTLSLRGAPLYDVSTTIHIRSTTAVRRIDSGSQSDAPPLAVLTGDPGLPSKITLRGREPQRVGKWLHSPVLHTLPATFVEDGTTYTWKMNEAGLLSLWSEAEEEIAWFQPSVPHEEPDGKRTLVPAYLVLRDTELRIQDVVVVSWVQKVRLGNRGQAKGQGVAAAISGGIPCFE